MPIRLVARKMNNTRISYLRTADGYWLSVEAIVSIIKREPHAFYTGNYVYVEVVQSVPEYVRSHKDCKECDNLEELPCE